MAFTQANLDAVEAAIATGELEVELNGKRVRYRSLKDLSQARDIIAAALNAATASPFNRQSYAQTKRGGV